jgi:hypothetical protein
MSTRIQSAEAEASLSRLIALLRGAIETPSQITPSDGIRLAVRSQGALAKFADSSRRIIGMSLNYQKALSENLEGGYELIDSLRRAAKAAFDSTAQARKKPKRSSAEELQAQLKKLEEENRRLREDLWLVQRAYDLRCRQARSYAAEAKESSTLALCQKEQREVDASLSLLRLPWNANKVPSIRPRL